MLTDIVVYVTSDVSGNAVRSAFKHLQTWELEKLLIIILYVTVSVMSIFILSVNTDMGRY